MLVGTRSFVLDRDRAAGVATDGAVPSMAVGLSLATQNQYEKLLSALHAHIAGKDMTSPMCRNSTTDGRL